MTRLAELIDIPEQVHESDLVINLQSGLHDPQRTVDQYVVTPQLAKAFDQAMHLVVSAIDDGRSKGTYLHGSFGSGKSHFMAILSLLLARQPVARRIPELGEVIAHYDAPLEGKKLVLVPYHVVGAETLEQVILGGYVAFVKENHPDKPLPAVYVTDTLLTDAQRLRGQLGDEQFFALLGTGSGADDPWGDLASGWDAARFDVAAAASPGDAEHDALVNALLATVFAGYTNVAAAQGTGFVPLEDGLAAISRHAKDVLGVDAVVLFLDELILWLMARMADQAFVTKEGSKISKLIETDHTRRPAPIISFIARQRDLREIVGDAIPGADQLRFADVLKYWDSRFGTITLEDRNLAAIAERRVLKPKSEAARQELARGFERSLAELDAAGGRDTLLTQTADLDEFRKLYPFNPALIEALVALSAALQRERTAIKVMVQLLSDHRDTIEVGDLVPLGDLFDVLAKGVDPMVPAMRDQFDTATRLWRTKFEPVLDREFGNPALADHLAAARLVKSLLLAALVPDVAPLRNLTVSRLVALNHGTIKAFIPGTERDEALALVNRWKAEIGELRVGDDPNDPTVAVQLSSVDIGPILDQARAEDRDGVRQRKIRELLVEAIGVDRADSLQPTVDVVWRGFVRKVDVMFANVRDTVTHPDATLRPDNELKLIVDYPFDPGHSQQDDIARIEGYVEANQPTNTVCWLPTFFTEVMLRHLGDLVVMDHVLSGDRFLGYAQHLSAVDRESAKASLLSQRGAKRDTVLRALRQAYGIEPATSGMVLTGDGAGAKFLTLNPAVTVRPPVAASLTDAARHLAAQAFGALYPGHPEIEGRVSTGDLRTVLAQVTKANALPDRRLENVDPAARKLLTNIAQPLQLGTMYQAHFVASEHWRHHFERKVGGAGAKVTVGQLRALLDDPKPSGMPKPLGDLVIAAFAAQTNRKVVAGGRVIPPDISSLDDAYELLTSHVPTQDVWDRAVANAQAIFGVAGLSPLPSAAALGELAQQVQTALGPHAATSIASYAAQLRTALATRHLTGEPPRLRNAHAAKELLDEITAAGERVAEVLAEFTPPTSAQALGRSFVRAGNLAGLLAGTNWALIETATGVGGRYAADAARIAEALADALRDDEVATPLEPRLRNAEAAATDLLAQVAHDQGKVPPPTPPPAPNPPVVVVNDAVPVAVRDAIRFAENLAAELGYRIEVTVTKVDR